MMSSVLEWAKILLITSFAGTLASLLMPEGGLNGYVRFAAAAVTAAVVAAPLAGILANFRPPASAPSWAEDSQVYAASAGEIIAGEVVRTLEGEVKNIIFEKSGINCRAVNIYIQKERPDGGELALEGIAIDAPGGRDALVAAGIPDYLAEMLGCPVEIVEN